MALHYLFMNLNPIVCSINSLLLAITLVAELAFRTLQAYYIYISVTLQLYQLHYVDNG